MLNADEEACLLAHCSPQLAPLVLTALPYWVWAQLRVGGGLELYLKQCFEGAVDPGKSEV